MYYIYNSDLGSGLYWEALVKLLGSFHRIAQKKLKLNQRFPTADQASQFNNGFNYGSDFTNFLTAKHLY